MLDSKFENIDRQDLIISKDKIKQVFISKENTLVFNSSLSLVI